jgi:RHS repeat-associated protein
VDAVVYGNGVSTGYSYDNRNRPENIVTQGSVEPLLNLTYTYDKTGSITQVYESVENTTETYGYDLLDRIIWGNGSWGNTGYTYDPVGNRLSKSNGGSTIAYSYDCMDRITSATGLGFDWDGNGNMVYKHDGAYAWNYTYDTLNRLTAVHKDGDLSALYTYDASGRRVRSWDTVDGSTDYVYSGLQIIDEINSGTHERHIYAGGMHIASNTTGTVEYYHVDHLGSTRLKTAANGSAIYKSNYEPFGPGSGESGSEDYRYTGKREDTTGLYYFGARYYDPTTGRFITRDTVFGELEDPQSLNRYVYCRNNPQKYTDPDGKEPVTASIIITGGIIKMGVDMHAYYAHNPDCLESIEGITGLGIAGVGGFVEGTITTAGYMLGGPVGILIDLGADVIQY